MRVEILSKKLRDAGYNLVEGDAITVPDETGRFWCDRGWAKDTSGEYATGERKPGVHRIQPHNLKIKGGVKNG